MVSLLSNRESVGETLLEKNRYVHHSYIYVAFTNINVISVRLLGTGVSDDTSFFAFHTHC
jgi:hypothetical protein